MNEIIDFSTRKPIKREERLPQPPFRSGYDVFVGTVPNAWDAWEEDPIAFEDKYGWGFHELVSA